MKRFQTLISAALAVSVVFVACNSGSDNNASAANADTVAPSESSGNSNQQQLEDNKKLVTEFYQALYGQKDSNAIDKYVADNVKEHNPLLKDGKEWLKAALRPFLENPNIEKTTIEIAQIAADGDMVWLLVKDVAPNGKVFARVNIFRLENGKVAEVWKVAEPVPAKSENTNTMF